MRSRPAGRSRKVRGATRGPGPRAGGRPPSPSTHLHAGATAAAVFALTLLGTLAYSLYSIGRHGHLHANLGVLVVLVLSGVVAASELRAWRRAAAGTRPRGGRARPSGDGPRR